MQAENRNAHAGRLGVRNHDFVDLDTLRFQVSPESCERDIIRQIGYLNACGAHISELVTQCRQYVPEAMHGADTGKKYRKRLILRNRTIDLPFIILRGVLECPGDNGLCPLQVLGISQVITYDSKIFLFPLISMYRGVFCIILKSCQSETLCLCISQVGLPGLEQNKRYFSASTSSDFALTYDPGASSRGLSLPPPGLRAGT